MIIVEAKERKAKLAEQETQSYKRTGDAARKRAESSSGGAKLAATQAI